MKYSIVLGALLLAACGSSNNSNPNSTVIVSGNTEQITIAANVSEPGDIQNNGQYTADADLLVTVPTTLMQTSNIGQNVQAVLNIGSAQFVYRTSGNIMTLFQCTGVCQSTVSIAQGSTIVLSVSTGYATQTTVVQANISATK
jgi:hypothetical protein